MNSLSFNALTYNGVINNSLDALAPQAGGMRAVSIELPSEANNQR